jgi:hypothetical protein
MKRTMLDRRTFLRGALGAAVALPILDIMLDGNGVALAGGDEVPRRFALFYNGQSLGADNDPIHNLYAPDTIGHDYDLKTALRPFGEFGDVRDLISVVSGLRVPAANGGPIPPGGRGDDFHIQAMSAALCGVRSEPDGYRVYGRTADQVVADANAGKTAIPSLVYLAQAAWYLTNSAPYGRDTISWRDDGGRFRPITPQVSPQAAYQSLVSVFTPEDPDELRALELELAKRRSVLDLVAGDTERLMTRLGRSDRIRMERHLDELRALELRLADLQVSGGACELIDDPGPDPAIGSDNEGDGKADLTTGYSNEERRTQVFCDLMHMAFTCDLTRSATLCMTMAQSHMSAAAISGGAYEWDIHELGHSGWRHGTEGVSEVIAWHMRHYARFIRKLEDTPEGAGTVLDNCAILMTHEGGHGYDPLSGGENSTHSTENMCMCIAGRAGGLDAGQHVLATGKHPANVLISGMHAVGVAQDLGEVRGVIPELFG